MAVYINSDSIKAIKFKCDDKYYFYGFHCADQGKTAKKIAFFWYSGVRILYTVVNEHPMGYTFVEGKVNHLYLDFEVVSP